jgi:hypothetical protein
METNNKISILVELQKQLASSGGIEANGDLFEQVLNLCENILSDYYLPPNTKNMNLLEFNNPYAVTDKMISEIISKLKKRKEKEFLKKGRTKNEILSEYILNNEIDTADTLVDLGFSSHVYYFYLLENELRQGRESIKDIIQEMINTQDYLNDIGILSHDNAIMQIELYEDVILKTKSKYLEKFLKLQGAFSYIKIFETIKKIDKIIISRNLIIFSSSKNPRNQYNFWMTMKYVYILLWLLTCWSNGNDIPAELKNIIYDGNQLNGQLFEEMIGRMLSFLLNYSYDKTPITGDDGIDLILRPYRYFNEDKSNSVLNNSRYLVQCKFYNPSAGNTRIKINDVEKLNSKIFEFSNDEKKFKYYGIFIITSNVNINDKEKYQDFISILDRPNLEILCKGIKQIGKLVLKGGFLKRIDIGCQNEMNKINKYLIENILHLKDFNITNDQIVVV